MSLLEEVGSLESGGQNGGDGTSHPATGRIGSPCRDDLSKEDGIDQVESDSYDSEYIAAACFRKKSSTTVDVVVIWTFFAQQWDFSLSARVA